MGDKREYDVLITTEISKIVRVRAHSMKEAATVIYDRIDDDDQLGGSLFSESVGRERVVDVVRSGDPWHFDRHPAALEGSPEGNKNA